MESEELSNGTRAGQALDLLEMFIAKTKADTARDALVDLITDLLHLARGRGLNAQALVDAAVRSVSTEAVFDSEAGMNEAQMRFRRVLPDLGLGYLPSRLAD